MATPEGLPISDGALRALYLERRAEAPKKHDNSALYAGEPITFWCGSGACEHPQDQGCGKVTAIMPEDYFDPPVRFCLVCREMQTRGFMDEQGRLNK